MAEQITTMVVKVDLECSKCYKKVKKVLYKFPEIQDQVYDVKQNTVTIKVVSRYPEKIKEKICRKGGKSIKSIEIKPPEKPKPLEPEQKKKEPEQIKTKEPEENKKKPEQIKPKEPEENKKEPEQIKPKETEQKKKEPEEKKKEPEKTSHPPKSPPPPPPETTPELAVLGCPPITVYPIPFGVCCRECYEGRGGGPCQQLAYGRPPCSDVYYGRPVYDSWGGGEGGGCTIM